MIIEENIMVPMRDGVKLATDIYRPAQVGQWPVLLTRLPYNKDLRFPMPHLHDKRVFLELNLDIERVVQVGYVVIAQDTQGRYASEERARKMGCRRSTAPLIAMSFPRIWRSPSLSVREQTKERKVLELSRVSCCFTFRHIANIRINKEEMFDV